MWYFFDRMGYDITKNIHEQFTNKYGLPKRKIPPKKIRRYEPSTCIDLWKNKGEGGLQ